MIADFAKTCRLGDQHQHKRDDAISPDTAVTHDRERLFAVASAAEPVCRIGKPVFMQGAGEEGETAKCQDTCQEWRRAEPGEHREDRPP
jgi:hypothetical protein